MKIYSYPARRTVRAAGLLMVVAAIALLAVQPRLFSSQAQGPCGHQWAPNVASACGDPTGGGTFPDQDCIDAGLGPNPGGQVCVYCCVGCPGGCGGPPPSPPNLNVGAACLGGTQRTVSWSTSAGETYQVQAARNTTFTSDVRTSGWLGGGSYTFGGLGHGLWYYHIRAQDANGTGPWGTTRSAQQDQAAPTTSATPSGTPGAAGWYLSTVQVTLSGGDPGCASVQSRQVQIDGAPWQSYAGPFTVAGEGAHTISYRSSDSVGNTEDPPGSLAVQIDTAAPSTSASTAGSQAADGWWCSDVDVTLSPFDATSGVGDTQYSLDGGGWTSGVAFTFSGGGSHSADYASTDVAGNVETAQTLALDVDGTPPTTAASPSGTPGSNGWWRSNVDIALSATDDHCGISATDYQIDGGGWTAYTGTVTVAGDGLHTLDYRSTDGAGIMESANSIQVPIDTVPPNTTASLSGPQGLNGWYVGPVTITLNGTDATSGVAVTYLDGNVISGPANRDADGSYALPYYSLDVAGNQEGEQTSVFHIDRTPPEARLSGGAYCPACGEKLTIQAEAHDPTPGSGLAAWRLEIVDRYGNVLRHWEDSGTARSVAWDGIKDDGRRVSIGAFRVRLWVQDEAGWTATAEDSLELVPKPVAPPTTTPTPTPTPTRTPTPTATPTSTPTPRPSSTPGPTATPAPVAVVEAPLPAVILSAATFRDDDGDGVRDAEEPWLAGLEVKVYGEGWSETFVADERGRVHARLPGPGTYVARLTGLPAGERWQATTQTSLVIQAREDGNVVLLTGEGPLPIGVVEGVTLAFGCSLARRVTIWLALTGAGLLAAAALTIVSDRRAAALRSLERTIGGGR